MAQETPAAETSAPAAHDGGRMPGWVKAFVLTGGLLVIVFVLLHLAGVGPTGHGP